MAKININKKIFITAQVLFNIEMIVNS